MKRLLLALLPLLLLCSCTTVKTEYVPVVVDITDVVEPVLRQRPDNSTVKVITEPSTIEDVVANQAACLYAWELWEHYADSLEGTLVLVRDRLNEMGTSVGK